MRTLNYSIYPKNIFLDDIPSDSGLICHENNMEDLRD